MHAAHFLAVLPEKFRHKTTKVKVPLPKAILIDFHGTISERRWEEKVIYPYVRQAVESYLQNNWHNETVQRCLPGLRNESFEQRFRNKFEDAPVIDDDDRLDPKQLAQQVGEFVIWQMTSKKCTSETRLIEDLVWRDGMNQKRISTPIYDDVLTCIREWRHKYNITIFVISSLDQETLKLLFRNTSKGNLDQYLTDYISAKDGDKRTIDVYGKLYDRFNNQQTKLKKVSSPSTAPAKVNNNALFNHGSDKSVSLRSHSSIRSPQSSTGSSFDGITRPIVYLTDSGQEAKAASLVADGAAFECLLVNRPGNKRFRTYYLSCFPYIDSFEDVEFVR